MNTDDPAGKERSDIPLTRADVERLYSAAESSASLDLSFQNLKRIDLSYFDLHSANLRGADLQGANLRGINLSHADLRDAHLNGTDLDGADLSHANLGDNEANRVDLHNANMGYTTLRGLDLRGFDLSGLDLQHADLNASDLRGALLHGTNLQGADLSSAKLHGSELIGAKLYGGMPFSGWSRTAHPEADKQRNLARNTSMPAQEPSTLLLGDATEEAGKIYSDRKAYLPGKRILGGVSDHGNVFQELKIRAQLDPVVRRKLAASPLQFLANFDLSFEEKRQIVLPHFSWVIEDNLAAMSFPSTEDAYVLLQQLGIKVILNLTGYFDDAPLLSAFTVYHIPIPNHKEWGHKPPTLYEMHQAISIIQTSVKNSQPVVVHCERGLGRTGTVIAGYLTACGFPAQEAIDHIRKLRPGSIETEEQEAVIQEYERVHK